MRFRSLSLVASLAVAVPAVASAQVLTFEGLGDQTAVGNFYNGGAGGSLGITFSSNSLSIIEGNAGGSGNFQGEPSPKTVLFFLTGAAATMDVAGGFSTGFSFFYSAINQPAVVTVWSGAGATGSILATLALPITTSGGPSCPASGSFCPFVPVGVAFVGTAFSVDFGGVQNQVAFDNITLNSATAGGTVPEPSTMALLGTGLVGMAGMRRRRNSR